MAGVGISSNDPVQVLEVAGTFLEADPVRNNLILTILRRRVDHPEPGRYWIAQPDGRVAGVVLQSPVHFTATISPMARAAVTAVVDTIVDEGVVLPGVHGEAATAAAFAGHWAERTRAAARPTTGQRLYEVVDVDTPRHPAGRARRAIGDEHDLLVAWFDAFAAETHEGADRPAAATVERRLAAGELWIWEDGTPVAMAGLSEPVAGVARVGPVFTPPECRGVGYASALVAACSQEVRAAGRRCILYTDLENPTSNAIYRALGYRAVTEALRYEFEPRA